jgi:hypothetical protein
MSPSNSFVIYFWIMMRERGIAKIQLSEIRFPRNDDGARLLLKQIARRTSKKRIKYV